MTVSYKVIPGGLVTLGLLSECADLYSRHYGKWSTCSPVSPGRQIKLSPSRLREGLGSKDARADRRGYVFRHISDDGPQK